MLTFRAQRANSKINFYGGIVSRYIPVCQLIFEGEFLNRKCSVIKAGSSWFHGISGLDSQSVLMIDAKILAVSWAS